MIHFHITLSVSRIYLRDIISNEKSSTFLQKRKNGFLLIIIKTFIYHIYNIIMHNFICYICFTFLHFLYV